MRLTVLLRELGKINKMFLTQIGNENEKISRSSEADRIHTKVHYQPYNQKGSPLRVYQICPRSVLIPRRPWEQGPRPQPMVPLAWLDTALPASLSIHFPMMQ